MAAPARKVATPKAAGPTLTIRLPDELRDNVRAMVDGFYIKHEAQAVVILVKEALEARKKK